MLGVVFEEAFPLLTVDSRAPRQPPVPDPHGRPGDEADQHQRRGRPRDGHELAARGGAEPDAAPVLVDLALGLERAGRRHGGADHQGEEGEAGEGNVDEADGGDAGREDADDGRAQGQAREGHGQDEDDAHGFQRLRQLVEVVGQVLGEAEVREVELQRADAELVVEESRDVVLR